MKEFKGYLKGFPPEVVEKMLERQVEQGCRRDVSIFERDHYAGFYIGGFDWHNSIEGYDFWNTVIGYKYFDHFFERYPKIDFPISLNDCKIELKHEQNEDKNSSFYSAFKDKFSEPIQWTIDRQPVRNREFMDNAATRAVNKAKIIYAEGKEVIFDLDSTYIDKGMLIIKAK